MIQISNIGRIKIQLSPDAESGPFFHCCSPSSFRICMNSSPVMVSFS